MSYDLAMLSKGRLLTTTDWRNKLYFGDNLDILCEEVADESVELIYLDSPYNCNAIYKVLFRERSGEDSTTQLTAFEDLISGTLPEYPRFAPEATPPRAPGRRRVEVNQPRLT